MSEWATTETATYDDGKYVRTAIVVPMEESASIDIVDEHGAHMARLNVFAYKDAISVDVIDVYDNYNDRAALTFLEGVRHSLKAGQIVCAWFVRRG